MAKKPVAKCHRRHSLAVADIPLPLDLSKELSSIFDIELRKNTPISAQICRNIRKSKLRALERMGQIDALSPASATGRKIRILAEEAPITDISR